MILADLKTGKVSIVPSKPKKTANAQRVQLADKLDQARAAFERAYSRLQRAARAMDRAKRQIVRLNRRLEKLPE